MLGVCFCIYAHWKTMDNDNPYSRVCSFLIFLIGGYLAYKKI